MKRFLSVFYDVSLFLLLLLFLPKLVWQAFRLGKYRKSFFQRLFPKVPPFHSKGPVIWLHAVSVGEVKALSTITPHIRASYPNAALLISTITETGQREAKRLIKEGDAIFYLPYDFSFIIRPFVKRLKPTLLVLIEGDFWWNLQKEVKNSGGRVVLLNGKISERSLKRFSLFKTFSREIFHTIDLFCVQNRTYATRFHALGISKEKLKIIGNLKFDIPSPTYSEIEISAFKEALGLQPSDFVITVGSTHGGEEEKILEKLLPFVQKDHRIKLLFVPRHPERFKEVEKMFQDKNLFIHPYSSSLPLSGKEQLFLIDQMGILSKCYLVSKVAIVGGSFVSGVGGHDIFEPAKIGVPVLFGPYMHKQFELAHLLLQNGVGKQLSLHELPTFLQTYLQADLEIEKDRLRGRQLGGEMKGSALKSWEEIKNLVSSS